MAEEPKTKTKWIKKPPLPGEMGMGELRTWANTHKQSRRVHGHSGVFDSAPEQEQLLYRVCGDYYDQELHTEFEFEKYFDNPEDAQRYTRLVAATHPIAQMSIVREDKCMIEQYI